MSDKVATLHPTYEEQAKRRKIWRDVMSGTLAMRKGRATYLPQFPAESDESYEVRLNTATFYNMTAKTVEVMTGMVFNKPVTLNDDVPDEIRGTETKPGLVENFDNRGNHLDVFAAQVFEKAFEGHAVILIDAPNAAPDSRRDAEVMKLRPYCVMYEADAVLNWFYEYNAVSEALELALIVFKEITSRLMEFEVKEVIQYRVFRKVAGVVSWELYEEREDSKTRKKSIGVIQQGTTNLSQIPAEFVYGGKIDNGVSMPPLMDMALKNIEHYQDYSDYRALKHKACVPMFYTVNMTGDEPDHIGGDVHWELGEGGSAGWAEVSGGSFAALREALEDQKLDMAKLGLSMLAAKPGGDLTATEALLNSIQETSGLQMMAQSLENALERSLGHMAAYLGKGEDAGGSIELGATWAEMILSDQQLTQFNTMVNDGNMSVESLLWILEKSGYLPPDVTAEEERARLDEFGGQGLETENEPLQLVAGANNGG